MANLVTFFGLRGSGPLSPPPYLSHYYLAFSSLFAYAGTSSRMWKMYHHIDHNVSPRDDLAKYGQTAVSKGKITQAQLDRIKRIEAAHANSMEHFPLFAATIVFAHVAKLTPEVINATAFYYIVLRILYVLLYIFGTSFVPSGLRSICWHASNIVCIRLLLLSGSAINGKVL